MQHASNKRKFIKVIHLDLLFNRTTFDHRGFTLIEIIAVLIIMSLLAVIVVPKFIDLDAHAKEHGIDAGIAEMNGRETLVWANIKLVTPTGWQNDGQVFSNIDFNLGSNYKWNVGPDEAGGTLVFQSSAMAELERIPSENGKPAQWSRK